MQPRNYPLPLTALSNVISVSAGDSHAAVLESNGLVWSWGRNQLGQIGDGTTIDRNSAVPVLSNVISIKAGGFHTLALLQDGTVSAWGKNNYGQLGNNGTTNSSLPVAVGSLSGVTQIAAGYERSLALKSDGTVWEWGFRAEPPNVPQPTYDTAPTEVSGLGEIAGLATGLAHSVALKADGTVFAWGNNSSGEIGDATNSYRATPVQVSGLTGIVAVSANYDHSLAIRSDGTVWAWGSNLFGQLGDGTRDATTVPVQVTGLSGVTQIVAAQQYSMAMKTDGTVWAWGRDNSWLGLLPGSGTLVPRQVIFGLLDDNNNGLEDRWEIQFFGNLNQSGSGDFDGDGITNSEEYQNGTDPTDYFNGVTPVLEIVGGDNQSGAPDTFLPQPLVARVKTSAGLPLQNAPVTFHVVSGGGQLGVNGTEPVADPYEARSDADGLVDIYFKTPIEGGAGSAISATCSAAGQSNSVVFSAFASSLTLFPAELNVQLAAGETREETLTLSNGGGATSGFCLRPQNNTFPVATYAYLDSDQTDGPVYEWNDISATGTLLEQVSNADDDYESFDLAFSFPYFGKSFTQVFVSSNGFVTLGEGSSQFDNYELPSEDMPSNEIAPFHVDLNTADSGNIFYQDETTRTVIQFDDVARYDGNGNVTFQIILNSDGSVKFLYKDLPAVSDDVTVGLQNAARDLGLTVSYQNPYLHESLAVNLFPAPRDETWFEIAPLTGSVTPGEPENISVVFKAAHLNSGVHNGSIELATDCFGLPLAVIPVAMTLLNTPPNVTLTSPAQGSSLLESATVVIAAEADDSDGTVTKVQFVVDGQILFEALSPPFQYSWPNPPPGEHLLSAVAFDNSGASTTSNSRTITSLADSDSDGLPDEWELAQFGNLDQGGSDDFDGDGISNADEYANGTDPKDFYNGRAPVLKFISGNHQLGFAGNFLPAPLVVEIDDANSQPIQNAPLTFTVTAGGGSLADPGTPTDLGSTIILRSAQDGKVTAALFAPADSATGHVVIASTGNGANRLVFSETTVVDSSTEPPAAPDSLSAKALSPQTYTLTWTDNSSSESGFIIERFDGSSWVMAGTVLANTASFHDVAPSPEVTYSYRVQAVNSAGTSAWSNTVVTQKWIPSLYIVVDLGAISSSPPVTTINNLGQTGGLMNDSGENVVVTGTDTVVASLWKEAQQIYDYGAIGGRYSSIASINNLEEIAGYTTHTDGASYTLHAYKGSYLNASNDWVDLGEVSFDNFDQVLDLDINFSPGAVFQGNWTRLDVWLLLSGGSNLNLLNRGGNFVQVRWVEVGTANYSQNVGEAFTLKRDGAINYLGVASGTLSLSNQSRATELNDSGAVVGLSGSGGFIWSEGQPMQTLGTALALAINNPGQIVGEQLKDGQVWPRFPVLIDNNRVTFLPVLPGYETAGGTAHGINNSGTIVGASGDTHEGFSSATASLWVDGTAINLNSLLPTGSGWQLSQAYDINDNGWIVGRGFKQGDFFEHYFLLRPPELMVDANRDGQMSFTDPSVHGADQTTVDKPYRFWLNDDDDTEVIYDGFGRPLPTEQEQVPPNYSDYSRRKIVSKRNLEDFARIWMNLGGLEDKLTSGEVQVGLKWKTVQSGSPAINIYPSADGEGSSSYLTDDIAAQDQIGSSTFNDAVSDKTNLKQTVDRNSTFIFKPDYWFGLSSENPKKCLLFEGFSEGNGELDIVFLDQEDNQIGEGGSVSLDLVNVKKMYERAKATPDDVSNPNESTTTPTLPEVGWVLDPNGNQWNYPIVSWHETKEYVIAVHGWNVSYDSARVFFAETTFKRLWQRGYRGRFAAFYWPTLVGDFTYNESEYRAWYYGEALKQYGNSLPADYTKALMAHSMGNVVSGSALRRGLNVANYAMLNAAVAASCYDDNPNLQQNVGTTPDNDLDQLTLELAYKNKLSAVTTHPINFYLASDSALMVWVENNRAFKPQVFYEGAGGDHAYKYFPGNPSGQKLFLTFILNDSRNLEQMEESLAYAAKSSTLAVGAEAATQGSVSGAVDLSDFGYQSEHSAFWSFTLPMMSPAYDALLDELRLEHNP